MRATQPTMINDLEFDALISEERKLEAEVPQYSIESGYSVTDGIIIKPETIDMTLFVTDTPVTWAERHGEENHLENVLKRLEEMYLARELVTVTTTDNVYTDMAIQSITFSKTLEVGYAREVPVTFQKVYMTNAETTTIPASYLKSGQTKQAAAPKKKSSGGNNNSGGGGGSGGGSGGQKNSGSGRGDDESFAHWVNRSPLDYFFAPESHY